MNVLLEEMLNDIPLDHLPASWSTFDLRTFAKDKSLWQEQQFAVEAVIKLLWKYYEDNVDYDINEKPDANKERRNRLYQWYSANGLDGDLELDLTKQLKSANFLEDYFTIDNGKLSYKQLINRCCFWMATGSGKTLVIVKLIEILWQLIQRKEIPANDILVLTHRDDLIDHLKTHVHEFNSFHPDFHIQLRELKSYADAKRINTNLFKDSEVTVFYYRSDNMSDEQKEKIVDFKNYDDNGKWYVLLDEAHKGDREDSKRQHIYSILARNGFLFNFSATFTDYRDLITTAANFNLAQFVQAGYGKHLLVLEQELRAFRDEEDYSNDEKQKIVLKSLIMLAYAKRSYERVKKIKSDIYHSPLLLTLVNSVNTEEADLKLFFSELERIAKGKVNASNWKAAKEELWEELKKNPEYFFESGKQFVIDKSLFERIDLAGLRETVFHSKASSDIEVLVHPSNKQEIAFKLKSVDKPFALIKIGDISGWIKETLAHYEIVDGFDDEGFFDNLNKPDSDINILMGSRSFYEGWDSNRPNVLNFINIGTGVDAKKFILQSIGRGVRIEPLKNHRKRLKNIVNAGDAPQDLLEKIGSKADPVETLIIFGTNREALKKVIEHLATEGGAKEKQQLPLFVNDDAAKRQLLVPIYKRSERTMAEHDDRTAYVIDADELQLIDRYAKYIEDDRVLMALHDMDPASVAIFKESLEKKSEFYKPAGKPVRNLNVLVSRVLNYFGVIPEEFEKFKLLENEISHFRHVTVGLEDISALKAKVEKVKSYKDPAAYEKKLDDQLERGEISKAEYKKGLKEIGGMVKEETFEYNAQSITIKTIANHYYVPIVISDEKERIKYIKHIIQEDSEVKFLEILEKYLEDPDNKLDKYDWWMFSKLDENIDSVYVPWYDGETNKIRKFNPDFVFWLEKGNKYWIVFVDPKGTKNTGYQHKIDSFTDIFEEKEHPITFEYNGFDVQVKLFLRTDNMPGVARGYKRFWFDGIDAMMSKI